MNTFRILLISVFLFSCNDWLNVGADTELTEEEMFSSDEGFHSALTGIYIGMKEDDLYSKFLSWHFIEYLAHYYNLYSGASDQYLHTHEYTKGTVSNQITKIWNGLYNLIANCNNLLENLEKFKGNIDPLGYQLVKGEALTLRAYFHFDLLRMFGHGNHRNRDLSSRKTIPYVTSFDKSITPQLTYKETFELLKRDLYEAIDLLYGENGENCYRITFDDSYFTQANGKSLDFFTYYSSTEKTRIDYFAARALLARFLMWEGTDEAYKEALEIAEDWILSEEAQNNWRWIERNDVTATNVNNRDRTFSREHIWHLFVYDLNEIIDSWFTANQPSASYECVYLNQAVTYEIFEVNEGIGTEDYRYTYLIEGHGTSGTNYVCLKLDQNNGATNYGNIIPMLSTAEMSYICAEVYAEQGLLDKAIDYLNDVRKARGISNNLAYGLNYNEVREEILKECRKEFLSLGQLFYFYKRWGVSEVVGYTDVLTDAEYVLPYPDNEIEYGNREQ